MDDAAEWTVVPELLGLLTILVNRVNNDLLARIITIAARLVALADHLTRLGVKFWMSSESG